MKLKGKVIIVTGAGSGFLNGPTRYFSSSCWHSSSDSRPEVKLYCKSAWISLFFTLVIIFTHLIFIAMTWMRNQGSDSATSNFLSHKSM